MSIVYSSDNKNLKKLVDTFLKISNFNFDKNVLVLTDKDFDLQENADVYIVPYDTNVPDGLKTVTYSLSNNKANVVVINIQNHPETKSFEILTDTAMGRVFINNKNKTPIEDVLICSAIFYGAGMDLSVILDVLNSILK
jgi:hypothetical protein